MLLRRHLQPAASPGRRSLLKDEYQRTLGRVTAMMARRPGTQLLVIKYDTVISDSLGAAERINHFLGGGLDVAKMAAAVEPALYRNRAGVR
jgi:hypothetical protein